MFYNPKSIRVGLSRISCISISPSSVKCLCFHIPFGEDSSESPTPSLMPRFVDINIPYSSPVWNTSSLGHHLSVIRPENRERKHTPGESGLGRLNRKANRPGPEGMDTAYCSDSCFNEWDRREKFVGVDDFFPDRRKISDMDPKSRSSRLRTAAAALWGLHSIRGLGGRFIAPLLSFPITEPRKVPRSSYVFSVHHTDHRKKDVLAYPFSRQKNLYTVFFSHTVSVIFIRSIIWLFPFSAYSRD